MKAQFHAQKTTLGTQFDMIYQDWGKLSTLGVGFGAKRSRAGHGMELGGSLLAEISPAVEQFFYQSLMAGVYAIGSYVPA